MGRIFPLFFGVVGATHETALLFNHLAIMLFYVNVSMTRIEAAWLSLLSVTAFCFCCFSGLDGLLWAGAEGVSAPIFFSSCVSVP